MKWSTIRLNQICDTQYGYTASADENIVGPKYLRITDIASGPIDWESVPYCKIPESDYFKYKLKAGDIVIARTGNTTGFAKLIRDDKDAVFASYLVRLKIKTNLADSGYVGRLIESDIYKNFVTSIKGGAAQGNANATTLTLFEFPLPSIDIQRTIASILSIYDGFIKTNHRRIQLLEESARLLFREWFVYFRFPGHEKVNIADGVPEGWDIGKIKDFGKIITGKTPSKKDDRNYNSTVPFIKTPDMHQSTIILKTEESLSETGASSQYNKYLPPWSILISCIGTVGVVAMNLFKSQTNQQINSVIPKNDVYRYYSFFCLSRLKPLLEAIGGGSTMANINKSKFENIKVIIPAKNVLVKFHKAIDPVFNQVALLSDQNQKLAQARDLLLPRLMSGAIDPVRYDKLSNGVEV